MRAYLARTESFVHHQIVSLRRYRPVVVAHHRRPNSDFPLGEGAIAEELLPRPLAALERLTYRFGRLPLPSGIAALSRYVRRQDAQLLHYHYLTDARFLLGLQRRTGLPAMVSGYGWDVSSFPAQWRGLGSRYLRPIFARLDCFVAMSGDMRDDLVALGCPEEKIKIHYYGSDTRRFRHPDRRYERDAPLTVLCVGRLTEAKGQGLVLQALRRVTRQGRDDFRLVIVGEGPARAELERLVADYGWGERVSFAGHVPYASPELVEHYRAADVFAQPSVTVDGLKEGIPGAIVEAMASGLPVIASRHAGIPAVIEPERHGLLVAEHDQDALAEALEALLADPGLRRRLGVAAAQRAADELDVAARTVELEQIYDSLLRRRTTS